MASFADEVEKIDYEHYFCVARLANKYLFVGKSLVLSSKGMWK